MMYNSHIYNPYDSWWLGWIVNSLFESVAGGSTHVEVSLDKTLRPVLPMIVSVIDKTLHRLNFQIFIC